MIHRRLPLLPRFSSFSSLPYYKTTVGQYQNSQYLASAVQVPKSVSRSPLRLNNPNCLHVVPGSCVLIYICIGIELELELIQTQMAQKPMLRAEVYAHAMRASQNRKKEVRREKEVQYFQPKSSYVLTSESGGRATHTVIELSFHLESNVCHRAVLYSEPPPRGGTGFSN